VIFKISEEKVVFQIDGVVADVATLDHFENLRPHGCMVLLVGLDEFRPYFDHKTITLHFCSPFDVFGVWLFSQSSLFKERGGSLALPKAALLYSMTLTAGYGF
jgi:hypothetical protein